MSPALSFETLAAQAPQDEEMKLNVTQARIAESSCSGPLAGDGHSCTNE
jgi:hypothetical protein